ncbi:MAG: ROK family protein [Hyphomicrobium sp.]|uniref:ROK family protein n=1 Tax=Hyphomicrobium sp. TaxID=82 RepID=UPI0039E4529C
MMTVTAEKMNSAPPEIARSPNILCLDIGGTLIKAATVNEAGSLVSDFITTQTPKPSTPEVISDLIEAVVKTLPAFGRVSVGFPGVVSRHHIKTAPNLGTQHWSQFDLEKDLSRRLKAPVRVLNDAVVYGLGVAKGPGRECVLTFGTGMGCALFINGSAFFGLELGQHNAVDDCNYDGYIGQAAYLELGLEAWNERAKKVLRSVQDLTNVDRLYIGGGNSRRLTFDLPPWASVVPPSAGISGGARLWRPDMDQWFRRTSELMGTTAEKR